MKSLVLITFGCIFLQSIYENNIIGLTIVEDKFRPFSNVDDYLSAGFLFAEGWGQGCHASNDVDANKYFCVDGKKFSDYDYLTHKLLWQRDSRWNLWWSHIYNTDYKNTYGASVQCYFLKEMVDAKAWFTVIHTNSLYWMIQSLAKLYEGGFIWKWDEWMYFGKINQNREFLDPLESLAFV